MRMPITGTCIRAEILDTYPVEMPEIFNNRRMLAAIVHRGPDEEGFLHGWDESNVATLLVERKSFAAMFTGIVVLIFVVLIRLSVRRYGEWKLGFQPVRFRQRVWGACSAFFQPIQSGPMTVPIEKPSDRTAR